jgi:hypothetical protein
LEDVAMTVDQSVTPLALNSGEASSRFGWLSAEDIDEALGAEPDNDAEAIAGSLMPPPAFPAWPRVYPGL